MVLSHRGSKELFTDVSPTSKFFLLLENFSKNEQKTGSANFTFSRF